MSRTMWVGAVAYNPKVVTIWEGMRRYFHDEAHLPVDVVLFQSYEAQVIALLAQAGDPLPYIDIAWNTNLAYLQAEEWSGHRCRAVAMRDTDLGWMTKIVAGALGSPFWNSVRRERLVPEGALSEIWTSPAYHHCMFTARPDLDLALERRFADALSAMSYDNPVHRSVLDAEGLQRWLPPHV